MEDKVKDFNAFNSKESMSSFIDGFRVYASNNRNNYSILDTIDKTIQKCIHLKDQVSLVKLYELKISQIEHLKERREDIFQLAQLMKEISKDINYNEGLALAYYKMWYIWKLKGEKKRSQEALDKSINYVQLLKSQNYTYHVCMYSFAVNKWLNERNIVSANILEKCADYFFENGFYRSFAQCLAILLLIYQQTQNKKKSMKLAEKIIIKKELINELPQEIVAIIHYFIGVSNKLCFSIDRAKNYFLKSTNVLKSIHDKSIYSGYYLRGLAHLTACYALQGKLELSYYQMKEVETLIEEGETSKNLDSFNKGQIKHDFNLTKFYVLSRLNNVKLDDLEELSTNIINNLETYHSDAVFLSEFLLNANLSKKQLVNIKRFNTSSTQRIEHILDFLIVKKNNTKEKQIVELVSTLHRRPTEDRMTLEERAFADLLAAQEYFKLKRYTEIYPLLRKYEKRLDEIEILELRLFMEAFIQIGAYKNGDMMGPVNQYLAIKKCRLYKFTKLENKLLDYLDIQAQEARMNTNYIYS
ncbi:hypothetical protein EU534_01330 [Candidatus Heimdallarchaeota archaeon]|nr:MAG: hypothetical protein EU534_01330 [Candidatus Heimdallarchaeota archaeon]